MVVGSCEWMVVVSHVDIGSCAWTQDQGINQFSSSENIPEPAVLPYSEYVDTCQSACSKVNNVSKSSRSIEIKA